MPSLSLQRLVQGLRQQVAQGEIELVLDQLQNYLSASAPGLRDEAILLTARLNRLRRDERRGVVSRETAQSEATRLEHALLGILEDVSDQVREELSPVPAPPQASEEFLISQEVSPEKILGINNLKQISWIERGLQVSKSVCRLLTPVGLGTGFLISPDLLMTNNHVIPNVDILDESRAEFNYQHDFEGNDLPTCRYRLDRERFHTNPALDYTIVGMLAESQKPALATWGCVLLNPDADPVPGEHVIIIQHPNGVLKQIAVTANQVVNL